MVGSGPAMMRVRELIDRVAPTEARVLIMGESGTGKELVAAAIHKGSARREQPFVRVNCAAIPRDLDEREMFGHERGAFTGATDRRIGRFELAHRGTLLLDEVGDLGAEAQAKLLRAIEAKEIERVGGSKPIPVDVRILSATNMDLERAVADGRFREDLYFRLNVIPLVLPALRERQEDIAALAQHFSALQRARSGRRPPVWHEDALDAFRRYRWPGNVRELANIIERLAILHAGTGVSLADVRAVLPLARDLAQGEESAIPMTSQEGANSATLDFAASGDRSLTEMLDDIERQLISRALSDANGSVAEASRRLRTDRPNLYRRMRRLDIEYGE